jgi:glycine cleavage system aminomethyltransferase T
MLTETINNLAELMESKGDLVEFLRNDTLAAHPRARGGLTPVPLERSNWVDEQRAWRNSAVLFDQSHHMPELFLSGPDAMKLLSRVGINSFENFIPGRAKQFVGCNHEGYTIGETVMYCHDRDDFELVSGMPLLNWVEYNAHKGGYDVTIRRDNHTAFNTAGRTKFRFGMDGPNAGKIFAEAIEGDLPAIKFFWTAKVRIAGCDVVALRHGMAGHQGVELSGRYEDGPTVREALIEIGAKYDLRPGGTLSYFSAISESGWMGSGFPALYTSPELADYRASLPIDGWEASVQLGGSFVGSSIEDYYVTPFDHDLGSRMSFDHDFIGREALERKAQEPHRMRRTLVWNTEDVSRVVSSMFEPGLAYKMLRLPFASYGYYQFDTVKAADGTPAGLGTHCSYSANESKMFSLGMIEPAYAEIGTELVLTWGEPNGGTRKPHVERHRQTDIRVTVAPAPYSDVVSKVKRNLIAA